MEFSWFLLNEEKAYLGDRLGDVLTAVHDLQDDIEGMGMRQIARIAEDLVNQLRKILHGHWTPQQTPYLKKVQKIAVALMRAVEEKDDLKKLIPGIAQELQQIAMKLGAKPGNLPQTPETLGQDAQQADMQLTGDGPQPQQPSPMTAQNAAPPQPPVQDPNMGQGGLQPPAPMGEHWLFG